MQGASRAAARCSSTNNGRRILTRRARGLSFPWRVYWDAARTSCWSWSRTVDGGRQAACRILFGRESTALAGVRPGIQNSAEENHMAFSPALFFALHTECIVVLFYRNAASGPSGRCSASGRPTAWAVRPLSGIWSANSMGRPSVDWHPAGNSMNRHPPPVSGQQQTADRPREPSFERTGASVGFLFRFFGLSGLLSLLSRFHH